MTSWYVGLRVTECHYNYSFAVYLFLGEHNALIDMLTYMEDKDILAGGQYAVVHVDLDHVGNDDPLRYFRRKSCNSYCMASNVKLCTQIAYLLTVLSMCQISRNIIHNNDRPKRTK